MSVMSTHTHTQQVQGWSVGVRHRQYTEYFQQTKMQEVRGQFFFLAKQKRRLGLKWLLDTVKPDCVWMLCFHCSGGSLYFCQAIQS